MSDDQISARRCSTCCISWPAILKYYGKCPQCGENTDNISNPSQTEIMSEEDAASFINHVNFERHLNGEELLPAPTPGAAVQEAQYHVAEREARRRQFDLVINGAGFTADELASLGHLEASLGGNQIESD